MSNHVNDIMDDWDITSYDDSNLMYNNQTHSLLSKRRVSKMIAHELTHQWFANIITIDRWSDIWLYKSLASWIQNLGINKFHPEWKDVKNCFCLLKNSM